MPLDTNIVPKHLTATLHHQICTYRKPERYAFHLPRGVVPNVGIDDPRQVRIEDARGREAEFTLDRSGFQLVHAPTKSATSMIRRRSGRFTIPKWRYFYAAH